MPPPSRLLYIVDGDADARHFQRQRMTYLGWEVRVFTAAAECILATVQQVPECILCDLSAPRMNALAIQGTLRAHGLTVAVVALTDHVDTSLVSEAHAVGIDQVLDKHCDAGTLETALKRAIKKRAMETQDARR